MAVGDHSPMGVPASAAVAGMTQRLRDRPGLIGAFAGVGAGVGGVLGGVAGLVIGLIVHPPTAWFAILELGIPAAVAGGVVGLLAALAVKALRPRRRR